MASYRLLLPLAALFGRVTQAHPGSDHRLCFNRARRSAQSALPSPVRHLPPTVPARHAR